MAVNKKSNLLECIFISKKSLEISLNLTSQIKQLSLTHFVLIVTEPNLEAQSFYSEYRGILVHRVRSMVDASNVNARDTAGRRSSPLHFAAGYGRRVSYFSLRHQVHHFLPF